MTMEIEHKVIVKNTFLEFDESDCEGTGSSKRCASVPRTWKPVSPSGSSDGERSSISTVASDGDLSDGGSSEKSSPEVRPKVKLNPGAAEFRMPCAVPEPQVPFSPMMMPVTPSYGYGMMPMMKLCPEGDADLKFPSATPAETAAVIGAAQSALLASRHVAGVQVVAANLEPGSLVTLEVELHQQQGPAYDQEVVCVAKAALVAAAEHSQNTYIMGYELMPFQDLAHASGFQATIGTVPAQMQDTVCWETYQKGSCPRRAMCHWCHPTGANLCPIKVVLRQQTKPRSATA